MTLLQLSYFCALARLLNFHEAAGELHISQPTLSIAIANLEKELDLMLFERKGKRICLTKCGEAYYVKIDKLLRNLDAANEEVRHLAREVKGKIEVAYYPSWPRGFVPQQVQAFLKDYRNASITFNFSLSNTPQILQGVRDGIYDVGFCSATTPDDFGGLGVVPLLTQEVVVITPHNHKLASGASVSLKELEPYPFVTYYAESGMRQVINGYLEKASVEPGLVTVAPDKDTIAALVATGTGCAVVAKVDSLSDYAVEVIPISDFECSRTLYLVHMSSEYLPQPVLRFINYIKRHCAKQQG